MSTSSTNLMSYVWKFSWIYAICIFAVIVITSLLNIDAGSSMTVVELMAAAIATRTLFVQKEQRILEKVEKKFLVSACFIASWIISIIAVGIFGIYLVATSGLAETQAMVNALLETIHLPAWIWLVVITVICLFTYLALFIGFSGFLNSDKKMLEAYQKRQLKSKP